MIENDIGTALILKSADFSGPHSLPIPLVSLAYLINVPIFRQKDAA